MGDCENILGDWGWLGVIARFSKAHVSDAGMKRS